MAPFEGDNWVSPFGMERNPETLVARAIHSARQLSNVSTFARSEYLRLVSEHGCPQNGLRDVGTFAEVCADLADNGWYVSDWNATPLTGAFRDLGDGHWNVWMDSTHGNGACCRVRLHATAVQDFVTDLERSGHWFCTAIMGCK